MENIEFRVVVLICFMSFFSLPAHSAQKVQKVDAQSAQQQLEMELNLAHQQINLKNMNLACAGDGNCESMPMGERPCGGPSSYLIFSNTNMYAVELHKLVDKYTELEKRINNGSSNIVSSCQSLPEPDPRCEKDKCVDHTITKEFAAPGAGGAPSNASSPTKRPN